MIYGVWSSSFIPFIIIIIAGLVESSPEEEEPILYLVDRASQSVWSSFRMAGLKMNVRIIKFAEISILS